MSISVRNGKYHREYHWHPMYIRELKKCLLVHHMSIREIAAYVHINKTTIHTRIHDLLDGNRISEEDKVAIRKVLAENVCWKNGLPLHEEHSYPEDYWERKDAQYML